MVPGVWRRTFSHVDPDDKLTDQPGPIVCEDACFTKDGKLYLNFHNTECILFPSRENRDWSKFKAPKKHKEFKPFEKVLRVDECVKKSPDHPWIKVWSCDFYSYYDKNTRTHYCVSGHTAKDDEVIPYIGNEAIYWQ